VLEVYGNTGVSVLGNLCPVYPIDVIAGNKEYSDMVLLEKAIRKLSSNCWFLDATQLSLDMGNPLFTNMIMMGAMVQTGEVDLNESDVEDIVRESFAGNIAEDNIRAAKKGMQIVQMPV
jgi:indolepyruvate ferredoxin oxidoreductase beta subunit